MGETEKVRAHACSKTKGKERKAAFSAGRHQAGVLYGGRNDTNKLVTSTTTGVRRVDATLHTAMPASLVEQPRHYMIGDDAFW